MDNRYIKKLAVTRGKIKTARKVSSRSLWGAKTPTRRLQSDLTQMARASDPLSVDK